MAIIDPEGLFNGDRLRCCSNAAQLHWPRLFLASDGHARLEINYARLVGRAYPTFNPVPSETELQAFLREYVENYLLFIYQGGGQLWGQWDTRKEFLPRYKTAVDRRSPPPPEPAFTEWKSRYREQHKSFPKCFGKVSETFLHGGGVGVGIGVGKTICASPDGKARVGELPSIDNPPFETTEPSALFPVETSAKVKLIRGMSPQQQEWFDQWWAIYWLRKAKKNGGAAFVKQVRTEARFQQIMAATRAQTPEMFERPPAKRPYPATWLNGERWEDESAPPQRPAQSAAADDYPELTT